MLFLTAGFCLCHFARRMQQFGTLPMISISRTSTSWCHPSLANAAGFSFLCLYTLTTMYILSLRMKWVMETGYVQVPNSEKMYLCTIFKHQVFKLQSHRDMFNLISSLIICITAAFRTPSQNRSPTDLTLYVYYVRKPSSKGFPV